MEVTERHLRLAAIASGAVVVLGSLVTGADGSAKAIAGILVGFGVGAGIKAGNLLGKSNTPK